MQGRLVDADCRPVFAFVSLCSAVEHGFSLYHGLVLVGSAAMLVTVTALGLTSLVV